MVISPNISVGEEELVMRIESEIWHLGRYSLRWEFLLKAFWKALCIPCSENTGEVCILLSHDFKSHFLPWPWIKLCSGWSLCRYTVTCIPVPAIPVSGPSLWCSFFILSSFSVVLGQISGHRKDQWVGMQNNGFRGFGVVSPVAFCFGSLLKSLLGGFSKAASELLPSCCPV